MSYLLDIIAPVYHEEENIERFLAGISHHVKTPHRILLIFQDKKDPTIPLSRNLKKKYPSIEILFTHNGVGFAKALKRGLIAVQAPYIAFMMTDLSDNPRDIDKMITKLVKGYDLVCGSRYIKSGKRIGGSTVKAFVSEFACNSLRWTTGIPTQDATNAFKCFKKTILKDIILQSPHGFELPFELVIKAYYNGARITDIPTVWRERDTGASKFKILPLIPFYLRWYMLAITKRFQIKL